MLDGEPSWGECTLQITGDEQRFPTNMSGRDDTRAGPQVQPLASKLNL